MSASESPQPSAAASATSASSSSSKHKQQQQKSKRKPAQELTEDISDEQALQELQTDAPAAANIFHPIVYHSFPTESVAPFRSSLLAWYDQCRRKLPWRGDVVESVSGTMGLYGAKEKKEREKERNATQLQSLLFQKEATSPETVHAANNEANVIASAAATTTSSRIPVSGYGVWVSEIMLQQTRVETVIDYYLRWMKRFPTINDLATSTIDEVRTLWAGLGYYRRAQFLLNGAKAVMEKHQGQLPNTVEGLLKIPGIGPYTAGAIGSIAFNLPTPLVDGNVIRVLARLRAMEIDPKARQAQPVMWQLAKELVDNQRPGDFNQALMELGATICTPLAPQCQSCPVQRFCYAYKEVQQKKRPCSEFQAPTTTDQRTALSTTGVKVEVIDIEDLESIASPTASSSTAAAKSKPKNSSTSAAVSDVFANPLSECTLCAPRATPPASVMVYPSKASKKAPVEQRVLVSIVSVKLPNDQGGLAEKYILLKRPQHGLLAGQWEFPTVIPPASEANKVPALSVRKEALLNFLTEQFFLASVQSSHQQQQFQQQLSTKLQHVATVGEVVHIFSHRRHLMHIDRFELHLDDANISEDTKLTWEAFCKDWNVVEQHVTSNSNNKKPKANLKKKPSKSSKKKKAEHDDEEDGRGDDTEDEEEVDDSPEGESQPRAARWVTLDLLQEDHSSSAAVSQLGLTTGVRKVVQLFTQQSSQKNINHSIAKPRQTKKAKVTKEEPATESKVADEDSAMQDVAVLGSDDDSDVVEIVAKPSPQAKKGPKSKAAASDANQKSLRSFFSKK